MIGCYTLGSGAQIRYELFNHNDSVDKLHPIVFTPGGRSGTEHAQTRRLAKGLEDSRRRMLFWDRRNCAQSDFYIDDMAEKPEPIAQAEDLHELLSNLNLLPAILVGDSSGGRVSLIMAHMFPKDVTALVFLNLTGGEVAANRIAVQYYQRYCSVAEEGGMEAVCTHDSMKKFMLANPSAESTMLKTDVQHFCQCMKTSAEFIRGFATESVLGLSDQALTQIVQPALCIHTFKNELADGMHTRDVMSALAAAIPQGKLVVEPKLRVYEVLIADFLNDLL
jgi:pimeloyl-ACP methyl ester carboxylesterase